MHRADAGGRVSHPSLCVGGHWSLAAAHPQQELPGVGAGLWEPTVPCGGCKGAMLEGLSYSPGKLPLENAAGKAAPGEAAPGEAAPGVAAPGKAALKLSGAWAGTCSG